MSKMLVNDDGQLILTDFGLSVFRVPRAIFDELPGFECDQGNGDMRFWLKGTALTDGTPIRFFCDEPPVDARQEHSGMITDPARSAADQDRLTVERTG